MLQNGRWRGADGRLAAEAAFGRLKCLMPQGLEAALYLIRPFRKPVPGAVLQGLFHGAVRLQGDKSQLSATEKGRRKGVPTDESRL